MPFDARCGYRWTVLEAGRSILPKKRVIAGYSMSRTGAFDAGAGSEAGASLARGAGAVT